MKSFTFKLENPISYSVKGEKRETYEIELKAPSNKNRKQVDFLKQALMKCALQQTKQNESQQ